MNRSSNYPWAVSIVRSLIDGNYQLAERWLGRVDSRIPLLARARTDSGDNPDRMDKAWYVTKKGQHDVQPKMEPQPNLQKDSEGRHQDGKKDSHEVHEFRFLRPIEGSDQRLHRLCHQAVRTSMFLNGRSYDPLPRFSHSGLVFAITPQSIIP